MDKNEAARQINRMIGFINEEARAKVEEIRTKNENEKHAEKLSMLTQLNNQIRSDYEKKKKDLLVQKKIEKSKSLSESRFSVMEHRHTKVQELKQATLEQLSTLSKKPEYKQLIRFLIAQGLLTIQETNVIVQCRKEDMGIVQGEIEAAVAAFKKAMLEQCNTTVDVTVTLDKNNFLPPAPTKGSNSPSCAGGVVLTARNNQIICRNTLDHRLNLGFEKLLPTIRGLLFGVREKPVTVAAPAPKHH